MIYTPYALLAVLAFVLVYIFQERSNKLRQHDHWASEGKQTTKNAEEQTAEDVNPYDAIEPLPDFDWRTTPPIRLRPFKPKYHLTMAVENMPLSDLVAMDNTYLDRIHLRRQVMNDHASETLACNPAAEPAVFEFYTWIFSTYLLRRFPTMYTLTGTPPTTLLNITTNEQIPLHANSPLFALRTLGSHIDTDFLFLLPHSPPPAPTSSSSDETQPIYHLEAFTTTFPSGFSTLSKLSLPLSEIHLPVPGYATKLSKSMDRFFARLPVGRAVRRANWTVTTHSNLFSSSGTHLYASEEDVEELLARKREAVDVQSCRLRCERQTLHRLPESGALVFAFKTYVYTLAEVKEAGDGEALAEAIEGFKKGSVPEMEFYKSGVIWGEKVKEYLRKVD